MSILIWFRQDLRLADHPAIQFALETGEPIIPVYIQDPDHEKSHPIGAASAWWLHQSLIVLQTRLTQRGSRLILRQGDALSCLKKLATETKATHVVWSRCYEPYAIERDKKIKTELKSLGIQVQSFNASLLVEPWVVETKEAKPYQVFTSFWKTAQTYIQPNGSREAPKQMVAPAKWPASLEVSALQLEPTRDWASGFRKEWTPGEDGASLALKSFLNQVWLKYPTSRDHPAERGTSRLSPHLHWGEISALRVWDALHRTVSTSREPNSYQAAEKYAAELGWREFGYHLLFHFPQTLTEPLRQTFQDFPWKTNQRYVVAWQKGLTGYPIVDAGMRELWKTGWMHNRVRMIVASFLVKHLLQPWQTGANWFWDTLVDADAASNTLGWQWVAGCGADATPYFRIFNPVLQGEKFDPDGTYVRKWVPELSHLSSKWIHHPWDAPANLLQDSDVLLGATYPHPIVDHGEARVKALQSFQSITKKT